jgi:hypothetical protein
VQKRSNSWLKLSFSKYDQYKKIILYNHPFFLQNSFLRKEEDIQSDFSIGCGAQLAYQSAPKILDEELSPSVVKTCTLSFISQKMASKTFGG